MWSLSTEPSRAEPHQLRLSSCDLDRLILASVYIGNVDAFHSKGRHGLRKCKESTDTHDLQRHRCAHGKERHRLREARTPATEAMTRRAMDPFHARRARDCAKASQRKPVTCRVTSLATAKDTVDCAGCKESTEPMTRRAIGWSTARRAIDSARASQRSRGQLWGRRQSKHTILVRDICLVHELCGIKTARAKARLGS